MGDPSAWTKLWWKAVDIAAGVLQNVISAGVVAAIAWFAWHLKKKRELKFDQEKTLQAERTKLEFNSALELKRRREKLARLRDEIYRLADDLESGRSDTESALSNLDLFLHNNDLRRYFKWDDESVAILQTLGDLGKHHSWPDARKKLASKWRHMPLPAPEDDTFDWS